MSSTKHAAPRAGARRGRKLIAGAIGVAIATTLTITIPQTAASAAGCGFLGLFACAAPTAPTGAPGTPVAALTQVNQSSNGGTNPKLGAVASTSKIGTPNAGTVPIVGLAAARADDGAFVAYESRVDARTLDLMIYSPALKGAAPVRLLLPPNYTTAGSTTWPSLYLIHGGNDKGDYQSWSLYTTLPQETANVNALIVMPSVGQDAFATNYWNYGIANNGNQYDTFAATELPQLLQRGYKASNKAAIAGISSGGYSALALAALHPGQYQAAASFSGLIDTSSPATAAIIQAGSIAEFKSPLEMWGDYLLQNSIWKARNPAQQLAGLKGTSLFVSAGNGDPGPLDASSSGTFDLTEPVVLGVSKTFVQKAQAAGLPVTADFYGNGTHSWGYWNRELGRDWSQISTALGISDPFVSVS